MLYILIMPYHTIRVQRRESRHMGRTAHGCGDKEGYAMAKHGYRMIDAEMHVMEPVDLWERYIHPDFKTRAPRRLSERRWDIRTVVEGEVMASMPGGD